MGDVGAGDRGGVVPPSPRIAYVMSRFPKLTETFILFELLAVREAGATVELYPLLRERTTVMHPEARPLVAEARYLPFLSWPILKSQAWYLAHRPRRYLRTLATVLSGTWRSPNYFFGTLGIYPKVAHAARRMRAEGIEHVHCHFANHPAMAGFIVRHLAGIPYSFTAHGSDLHVDHTFLWPKVRDAAFVVAISEDNRREILGVCPGDASSAKVVVLHCGVDTDRFHPPAGQEEAAARRASAPLRLICIGTLHEVKGQTVLLDACARLARRGIAFRCTFVGEGPDAAALSAKVARLGLEDSVELVGRRTRDEVIELLAASDILVAPSVPTSGGKREGIPVVLMEAMATGVPVVASALSGIPELVEDERSGLLVPPGDPDALADALARLAGDPELLGSLGMAGRARILEAFDIRRIARSLIELVDRSRHRPARAAIPRSEVG
jgi:colanic acid/amylovoran biosynthesis glycosyltransferase